jgi:hypothetical protein
MGTASRSSRAKSPGDEDGNPVEFPGPFGKVVGTVDDSWLPLPIKRNGSSDKIPPGEYTSEWRHPTKQEVSSTRKVKWIRENPLNK